MKYESTVNQYCFSMTALSLRYTPSSPKEYRNENCQNCERTKE